MPPRIRQAVHGPVRGALEVALDSVDLLDADRAVVELGRRYADQLDADSEWLPKIGRQFLDVLTALRMTPAARRAVAGGDGDSGSAAGSALDDLRARRAVRAGGAQAVDPAAP